MWKVFLGMSWKCFIHCLPVITHWLIKISHVDWTDELMKHFYNYLKGKGLSIDGKCMSVIEQVMSSQEKVKTLCDNFVFSNVHKKEV